MTRWGSYIRISGGHVDLGVDVAVQLVLERLADESIRLGQSLDSGARAPDTAVAANPGSQFGHLRMAR